MKPVPKLPFKPASATTAAAPVARPGFPARLSPGTSGVPMKKVTSTPVATPQAKLRPQLPAALPRTAGLGMDSQAVRARMVQKLAAQGISDERVLTAMGQVERHRFVDTALANQAYEDTSLPIGLGQTISKPSVVARMLELIQHGSKGADGRLGRVLEVGTGCGYQAAVASHLTTEVYSIERLRGLHDKARENLRTLRLANVHLLFGDGMLGFPKGAPYAAIVAAAGGEAIPQAWVDQLAMGGRLVAPLQAANGTQALVVVDKTPQGIRQTVLEAVNFVPLKSGTS